MYVLNSLKICIWSVFVCVHRCQWFVSVCLCIYVAHAPLMLVAKCSGLRGNKRYCSERERVQFSRAEVILLHPALAFIFLSPVLDFSPSLMAELMLSLLGSTYKFMLMSAMKTASHLQIFAKQQSAYSLFFSIHFSLFVCSLSYPLLLIFLIHFIGC